MKRRDINDGFTTCSACREIKPVTEFGVRVSRWDGLSPTCKVCLNKKSKELRAANKIQKPERVKTPRNEFNRSLASKQQKKQYSKKKYHDRKASGLCTMCPNPPRPAIDGHSRCDEHLRRCNESARRTSKPQTKESRKAYWGAITSEVLTAYGGVCKCCGESEPILLTIDHVYNDGKKHRQEGIKSHSFYLWLRRHGYPQDRFQCLCFNCNMGKYRNGGVCPHEESARKLFLVSNA